VTKSTGPRWYNIVGFNVPLDTLRVISKTILRPTVT